MNHNEEGGAPSERKKVGRSETTAAPLLLEVTLQEPCRDCACFSWDQKQGHLRLCGIVRGNPALPADLATFLLEEILELPVLILSSASCPPETQIQVRVLGALHRTKTASQEREGIQRPLQGWTLVSVPTADPTWANTDTLEDLPGTTIDRLTGYLRLSQDAQEEAIPHGAQISSSPPQIVVQRLRESRVQIKRQRRMQTKMPGWLSQPEPEQPGTWKFVEGLSAELRAALLKEQMATDEEVPYAQAEQLIQFVPQRFTNALRQILMEDERLLAFLERPLLHHRAGWLRLEQWRSNAGLFLVTDRQALWLRDFFSPGNTFLQGGYIVHVTPLERLEEVTLVPPGPLAPDQTALRHLLTAQQLPLSSPYQRLIMQVASETGREIVGVDFPQGEQQTRALERVVKLLQAFLASPDGRSDRRVRRLPTLLAWQPHGAEARRLEGIGGFMSSSSRERLEQCLAKELVHSQEEALVSVPIPALEDYQSPARLVVLTRQAILVLDEIQVERSPMQKFLGGPPGEQRIHLHRYPLRTISTAHLRYSLVGSSLSFTVPLPEGQIQRCTIPFHSPAIARFLPLFTRLRSALSQPPHSAISAVLAQPSSLPNGEESKGFLDKK